jgi:hypothetical protein
MAIKSVIKELFKKKTHGPNEEASNFNFEKKFQYI